jgi:pyruvate dehydrogenase E2 component (dihydrolipoamide acetyltransferase)
MSQFLMPSLGADMESAILMEWLVKEGDSVKKNQVVAEVETSKGVIEIEVFEDGIVDKLLVEPETECKVGMPLALIRSEGENVVKEEPKTESISEPREETSKVESAEKEPIVHEQKIVQEERVKISPAARKRAEELGVDLNKLTPKDGVIQLNQVEDASSSAVKAPLHVEKKEEVKSSPKDGMRQAIAAAMSRSNAEIPHYYLSTSINMTPSLAYLEELNKQRSIKDRILPVAMLIRAVVLSLVEVPELNGFWQENEHQISKEIHPGIAIALRKGGLITPALLDAQDMSLNDTMNSISDLITRTRSGKLRGSEMTKQTITITNLGDLGVESVYGVIYPPQLAVVGLGAIMDKPWAEGDALSVRKVLQATLAGDHRATDGRTGALFLDRLNKFLQNPEGLL